MIINWFRDCAGRHFAIYTMSFLAYWGVAVSAAPDDVGYVDALFRAGHLWKVFLGVSAVTGCAYLLNRAFPARNIKKAK